MKPEPIPTLGPEVGVVSVSAGGGHSLALTGTLIYHNFTDDSCLLLLLRLTSQQHTQHATESGQVYGWGFNAGGRLGLGNESSVMTPTPIKALADKRVLRAICGLDHSLFITQA